MKFFLVIFLLLIVGGLVYYQNFWMEKEDDTDSENNDSFTKIGNNAIFVSDQRPGSFVLINLVFLEKSGYVVIYTDNRGQLGEIVGGTRLLAKGESKGVVANLVRPAVHGEELFAVIHEETGDGIFTPSLDTVLRDNDNNIIFMKFGIDQRASVVEDTVF